MITYFLFIVKVWFLLAYRPPVCGDDFYIYLTKMPPFSDSSNDHEEPHDYELTRKEEPVATTSGAENDKPGKEYIPPVHTTTTGSGLA